MNATTVYTTVTHWWLQSTLVQVIGAWHPSPSCRLLHRVLIRSWESPTLSIVDLAGSNQTLPFGNEHQWVNGKRIRLLDRWLPQILQQCFHLNQSFIFFLKIRLSRSLRYLIHQLLRLDWKLLAVLVSKISPKSSRCQWVNIRKCWRCVQTPSHRHQWKI